MIDLLCSRLFNSMMRDVNHKLAELLPPCILHIRDFGERNVCRNGCDKNTERTGARTLFLPVAVAVSCCLANPVGNYNGCCGRVWLWREFKMAADIDVYLFALMEGDIDEEEYLLLIEEFDNASMKQSRFPYEEYDPFDWNALDELVCKTEFRFEKNDVPRLLHVLQIPVVISIERCNACPGIEALCILLKRFTYPVRYCDMVPLFGRSVPELCRIVHYMVNLIYENHHFRLTSWNQLSFPEKTFSYMPPTYTTKELPSVIVLGLLMGQ